MFIIGAALFTAVVSGNAQCACSGKATAKATPSVVSEGESLAYFKAAAKRLESVEQGQTG